MQRASISRIRTVADQWSRRLSLFWIAVSACMIAVLTIVGVLQYRWTKQLSETSQTRLATTLQPLMIGWHLDFYGELSAICAALRVSPDSGARENWNDYLRRYVNLSRAPINPASVENIYVDPGVVKNIYFWQTAAGPSSCLFRLDPEEERIEPATAPQNLQGLLTRLKARSSSLSLGLRAWERVGSVSAAGSADMDGYVPLAAQRSSLTLGWQFDQNVPALVRPIVATGEHSSEVCSAPLSSKDPVNWIVVVLNLDYIQSKVLPNLTKRDFSSREGLEYKLAVIESGATSRSIYSSDPGFPNGSELAADSRMNIFGPPPESVKGDFWQAIKDSESVRNEDWRNFSAPVWFPVIQYGAGDEPWLLVVQHRTGPLDAIATSIWHRNLVISGIVFLLLACGMVLIVFVTRRAQKLAQLQLDFVTNISHELLTSVAAIHSAAQNLRDGLCATKADSLATGSNITVQARQLTDMVRQILLFVSTQNGTIRYTRFPLHVSDVVETVRRNVTTLLEGNGFEIDEQVEEGLPEILGDLPALSQCIQNLIVNAVKYSGKSRRIGISATVHETKTGQREIRISVRDYGRGISNSELRHIFEPFYRSPDVVNAQIHGTGLGLAVAKRIARAMGGALSVISALDEGSTFTLHLPVMEYVETQVETLASDPIGAPANE
jgi:signal transduction histidine kinase